MLGQTVHRGMPAVNAARLLEPAEILGAQTDSRRADVDLIELATAEGNAARIFRRHRHHPIDLASRRVADDLRGAPLSIPQEALGIDRRTVGAAVPLRERGEFTALRNLRGPGVVIAAENARLRRITVVQRVAVGAEANTVGNRDAAEIQAAQTSLRILVETADRMVRRVFVEGAEYEVTRAIAASVIDARPRLVGFHGRQ